MNHRSWPVVVETLALLVTYGLGLVLLVTYGLGLVLTWLARPAVALLYAGVLVVSNLTFVVLICPYCRHCEELSCHSGYHHLARFVRHREGRSFARQFSRGVAVVYPIWLLFL